MALAQAWSPSARSLESVFKVLSDHDHPFVMVGKYALTDTVDAKSVNEIIHLEFPVTTLLLIPSALLVLLFMFP